MEWLCGTGAFLGGLASQRRNVGDPSDWKMLLCLNLKVGGCCYFSSGETVLSTLLLKKVANNYSATRLLPDSL